MVKPLIPCLIVYGRQLETSLSVISCQVGDFWAELAGL